MCNILTSDPAIDQETGAPARRYQGITLTVDGLNWVQMRRSQEAGGRKWYNPVRQDLELVGDKML